MKSDHSFPKKGILRLGAGLLIAATLPVLAGCVSHSNTDVHYQLVSHLSKSQLRRDDIASLRAVGVQVIRLGQTYRLVIHSSQLFNYHSANFHYGARGMLKMVARILNSYHIVTVRVAAYSDNVKSGAHKDALTARQAAVVQSYLSDRGVSARLVYSNGQGEKNPVAWNGAWAGRHANRRIEISFMYIPTKTIYE